MSMVACVVSGVVGGVAYSLSGLANAADRESFDIDKMGPTLILSAVIGGVAGFQGVDYGFIANSSIAAGFTVIVEKLYRAVKKLILSKKIEAPK